MENLIFLTCFSLFAILTSLSMLTAGFIFEYKSPDNIKSSTYECGLTITQSAKIKFNIKYFFYLIMLLIFDISSVFLYPLLIIELHSLSEYLILFIYLCLILSAFTIFILSWRKNEFHNNCN